ncbi:MAG TPA: leucine--tRNA ligase [Elusimicrobia bacterium]|nr:MAG: leucine--tRNA ligase [Elusimicrobia bacterium GWA2_66_18]OGR71781.1 MAG: leucine--tRNA ligase [Elusimicrobia bacterium GWC2_65_9]HAZ07520.1 leucine--tRNA ligase [Elusimicrobiota bacterium]
MTDHIPFAEIEKKWQDRWEADGAFRAPRTPRPGKKFYCLDMFPYPSAAGLHVGHPEGYAATDILCRFQRMRGFDVLHPMGWDAFGLPAENFAIATNTHPAKVTKDNVVNFRRQIKSLGFSYDWDREIDTTDPGYYRWTQWIFLQLFKKGLAYESTAPINWCPSCKTGLANEEVFKNACERCGAKVERKSIRQWALKITAYADRLEKDLEELDWPESTLSMQRHWIGRSEGAEVSFGAESGEEILVFTTRPDTLFGATYMVLAPEHALTVKLTAPDRKAAVAAYIEAAGNKSDMERTELQKEKTGIFTGGYAVNPVNGKKIPVYIADYVLASYGAGAIMAVPGHDDRDHSFAMKYGIPVLNVVEPPAGAELKEGTAFTGNGTAVNSGFLNGLPTSEAKTRMISWLEENKVGRATVNYKLRDWLFSRQRYWGEPIPIVHCAKCGLVPVPEDQLPVRLPEVADYQPTGAGESPLANVADWVNTKCPHCAGPARRETNTMPQWAGSCWYYLRFIDSKNDKAAWAPELEKAWGPVDCYVGGAEHAVLHLLYARFWHKVLFDLGFVSTKEPFQKLRHQGMILSFSHRDSKGAYHPPEDVEYDEKGRPVHAKTGEGLEAQIEKMSKSKKNVVNPDAVIKRYGADAFRLYEMFMGPFEHVKPWDMRSIEGVSRFLRRTWTLVLERAAVAGEGLADVRHRTIKKVTEDIEAFAFNTCISQLMIYLNEIQKEAAPAKADLETLLILLNPFAPHLSEELWSRLGHAEPLCRRPWPSWDEKNLVDSVVEYAVQVNGKLRATFTIAADAPQAAVQEAALAHEKVKTALNGKTVIKTIVVPKKLVNLVVK